MEALSDELTATFEPGPYDFTLVPESRVKKPTRGEVNTTISSVLPLESTLGGGGEIASPALNPVTGLALLQLHIGLLQILHLNEGVLKYAYQQESPRDAETSEDVANRKEFEMQKKYTLFCAWCGKGFTSSRKHQKTCSRECSGNRTRAISPSPKATNDDRWQYIISHIDTSGGADACHLWTGHSIRAGYGRVKWSGRTIQVTRAIWMHEVGEIGEGMEILHKCDTPRCCNLKHLSPGTHTDNMRDMKQKGRSGKRVTGESHHLAKLSDEFVREIRATFTGKRGELMSLARKYNVTHSTIRMILDGISWKQV